MKKIKIFVLSFLFIASLFLIGANFNVKAASIEKTDDNITIVGASIRTADPVGLRFVGEIGSYVAPEGVTITKYGVAIAYGEQTVSNEFVVGGKVGGYTVVNGEVNELDAKGRFYLSLINIPKNQFDTAFTARAYIVLDNGDTIYGSTVTSRRLSGVAIAAKRAGETGAFIDEIYAKSETTLNLNEGNLNPEYSFNVKKFNTDVSGNNGVLSPKGYSKQNGYWTSIGFNQIPEIPGVYKVVILSTSMNNKSELIKCDYILDYHSGCTIKEDWKNISKLAEKEDLMDYYVEIEGTIPEKAGSCDLTINFDKNYEKMLGNKMHLAIGEELPIIEKDYYNFAGWYANPEFSGDAIANQDKNRNLYAKFTPIDYTVSYELNGGVSSAELVKTYNIDSTEIILQTEATMTKEGNLFKGWYDNPSFLGSPITSIPTNSTGNKTYYAKWEPLQELTVSLNARDIEVLQALEAAGKTPVIIGADYTGGNVNGGTYQFTCGQTAFPTISAALAAIDNTKAIYLFAGQYDERVVVNKNGILICGPNYGIKGTEVRNPEAKLLNHIIVEANNIELNGISITGIASINPKGDNCTIKNIYSDSLGDMYGEDFSGSSNRCGVIASDTNIANLTIVDNYFYMSKSNGGMTAFVTLNQKATNLKIENNYMELNKASEGIEAIMLYNNAGTLDINNNKIYYRTGNWLIQIGNIACTCSTINIKNNILGGSKDNSVDTSGIAIIGLKGNCTVNFEHNQFLRNTGTSFRFEKSTGTSTVNFLYNYFDSGCAFNLPTNRKGSAVLNFTGNCYMAAQKTATPDYNVITTLEDLEAAYQEYLKPSNN